MFSAKMLHQNIKAIVENLEAIGDSNAEHDLVEYNNLIIALETITENNLTWVYVRDRLIHEADEIQRESAR